jgi:hypothetical protein
MNILRVVKSKDHGLLLYIFNTNLLFTSDNLNGTLTIIQLHINFITHACDFPIYDLILALTLIPLHINFNIHPCAFLIHVFIQTYIHFVYY